MSEDRQPNAQITRLPNELVDRLTKPFARFLRVEAAGGAILLLFTVAALVLSNSPWAEPFCARVGDAGRCSDRRVGVHPFGAGLDQRRSDDAILL